LAFFTRTAGISLIAAGIIAILFFSNLKIKNRIIYGIFFTFIGFLPFSIWTIKNKLTFGYTSAEFLTHPLLFENLKEGIKTVSSWFYLDIFPFKMSVVLLVLILGTIVFISIYISEKVKKRSIDCADNTYKLNSRIINIFLIYTFFYIIEILSAQAFYVADIRMDARILIPVFISTFIIIVLLVKRSLDYFKNKK